MDERSRAGYDPRSFDGDERHEQGEQLQTMHGHWDDRIEALTRQIRELSLTPQQDRSEGLV